MAVDLGGLTVGAFLVPPADISLHAVPNKPLRNSFLCGTNASMGESVDFVKN